MILKNKNIKISSKLLNRKNYKSINNTSYYKAKKTLE